MSKEPPAALRTQAVDCSASSTQPWSDREHAAQPARALGPKAARLHERRRRGFGARRAGAAAPRSALRLTTLDGSTSLLLCGTDAGLYVQRTRQRPPGLLVVQSMIFHSASDFARWCDAEPLRFADPNLHRQLRRHGEDFFDATR